MTEQKILVWDAPTRVFHWLFAASFAGAFLTADSERLRDLHVGLGYTMLGLLVFRLIWGVVGTRYARFTSFVFAPRRVFSYLAAMCRFRPQHHAGHNPAGAWAIYIMLALTLLVGLSGYATYNEIGGDWLEEVHEFAANAFLFVVLVHIAGVVLGSLAHRENLIRSMLTGYKRGSASAAIRYRHRTIAMALVAVVTVAWIAGPDKLSALPGAQFLTSAPSRLTPDEDD